jgi:signal peptidase I
MGKIFTILLFVAGAGVLFFVLESVSPVSISSLLKGGAGGAFGESACTEIVTVPDTSMEPTFKVGAVALFNKCIEGTSTNLKVGTIVLVEPLFRPKRIRIVRKKEELAGEVNYQVSTSTNPKQLEDVPASDIKGVYQK